MEEIEVDAELETDEEVEEEIPIYGTPPSIRHFGDSEGFVGPVEQTDKEKAALQKELHGSKK